jgi:hypothetical protein
MMTERTADRWAPWWAYVVPILGLNYLRQVVLPFGTLPEYVDALLAIAIAVVLFVLITAGHRATRR